MEEVFGNLESNNVQTVENAKKELLKTFSQSKLFIILFSFHASKNMIITNDLNIKICSLWL